MLKSLYPQIDWDSVDVVGFDQDGTLYDEAEFIAQVYLPIAKILAAETRDEPEELYSWMLKRWLEKGSSYPRIFSEAIGGSGFRGEEVEGLVRQCLQIFRYYEPQLTLSARTRTILDALHSRYPLFMITDGSVELQKRKFASLGLSKWIKATDVAISGSYGTDFCKPSIKMLSNIRVLEGEYLPNRVVFFGDRQVDAQFAVNAGFQFVQVTSMHPVNRDLTP